jgi:hypothetical protein
MKRVRRAVPWLLLAGLTAAYLLKPDGAAALTIFPAWTWLPLGLVPGLVRLRKDRRGGLLLLLASVVYGLAFSEEWVSLARGTPTSGRLPETLRLVTLNCAGGTLAAAEEVGAFRPDVVLLQESPGRDDLAGLARRLFGPTGVALVGADAAILVRGPIQPLSLPRGTGDFVGARATVGGHAVTLVSLRLLPPIFRIDLFNPEAWRELANNRRARREEIETIVRQLPTSDVIVGGDFNCQSGDRALDAMPPHLRDAFYEAGLGWGHSAVNDYPLARIDQLWISPEWRARQVFAVKTIHSDHRMVVGDFAAQ